MELEVQGRFEPGKVEESIRDIIKNSQLCSLATIDETDSKAHIATAFFAFDDSLNFYILTEPETEHCQHLEENDSIALSIYDSRQDWTDDKQGLQVFGTAERIPDGEASEALNLYLNRFPPLEEFASNTEDLQELDSSFYRVTPERTRYSTSHVSGRRRGWK